jgi:glycyl-tRNA synthetase alpha chain
MFHSSSFVSMVIRLKEYWKKNHCILIEGTNCKVGAATFHPHSFFSTLKDKEVNWAFIQLCDRPDDSRRGKHNDRLSRYYQFQVMLRPITSEIMKLYLESFTYLGLNLSLYDSKLIEDNWHSKSLGAYGYGWEHWINGSEVAQLTYFEKMASIQVQPLFEITYGCERIACLLQKVDAIRLLKWDENKSYEELHFPYEEQASQINLNKEDIIQSYYHAYHLIDKMLEKKLCHIAYEYFLKANQYFNLLDASGDISTADRNTMLRNLTQYARLIGSIYLNNYF